MQVHLQGAHVLYSLGNELCSSDGINKPTALTSTAQMGGLTNCHMAKGSHHVLFVCYVLFICLRAMR